MTNQQITAISNGSTRRYWIGSDRRFDRYNRSLVNRIDDLMDPSFLMDWKILLKENNEDKRGHPYRTPSAFITFLAKLRAMYSILFRSLGRNCQNICKDHRNNNYMLYKHIQKDKKDSTSN